ncbi:MAG: DUF2934 domain-containing protein [Acetobacteraceae bacterium]|nr:DUF2934 domain-containing protein [Acetobacteraceae bacterium]
MDDIEQRIRERAYQIWEEEGRPDGRALEHWERARFLVGIEANPEAGKLPNPVVEDREKGYTTPPPPTPVEPIEALENQGEFPDRFADQGEKSAGPMRPHREPEGGTATELEASGREDTTPGTTQRDAPPVSREKPGGGAATKRTGLRFSFFSPWRTS